MRNMTLAVYHDEPALQLLAERLIEGTIADKPHVLAIGQAQLEKRVGKGPLPATMKALLRLLETPEPIPVGTG
jgi:hypothetical protein